jgi:hypothetical protein
MTTPEPGTPAVKPRGRSILVGLLAVLALLVPAGIGIAVGVTILGAETSVEAQPSPPASSAPSDVPTAEPDPAPVVVPIDFSSPSGNLRCHIDGGAAYCHQGGIRYAEPAEDCAAEGVAIGVTAEKTYWPCLAARPALTASVPYDVPVVNGEFTCVINLAAGVRCTNAAGGGFTMEYTAGVATF